MPSKYRIVRVCLFFIATFFISSILSYYFLPEGCLKGINTLKDTSDSVSAFKQIFSILLRNCIVILFMTTGNIVAIKIHRHIFPFGYFGAFIMFVINGITLGTWSFSARTDIRPGFFAVMLHSFDILHNSGLLELFGVATIVAVTGRLNMFIVDGGTMYKSKIPPLNRKEVTSILFGVVLIALGAMVEAYSL